MAQGFIFVPGTWSGVALRVGTSFFAAAAAVTIMFAPGAVSYTEVYWYLSFEMMLHCSWSICQAVIYIACALAKDNVERPGIAIAFILALLDALVALVSFTAACASAYVTLLLVKDTHFCRSFPGVQCGRYQLGVAFGFVAWFLETTSALSNFCLLVKLATQQHAD